MVKINFFVIEYPHIIYLSEDDIEILEKIHLYITRTSEKFLYPYSWSGGWKPRGEGDRIVLMLESLFFDELSILETRIKISQWVKNRFIKVQFL